MAWTKNRGKCLDADLFVRFDQEAVSHLPAFFDTLRCIAVGNFIDDELLKAVGACIFFFPPKTYR
jgi:hypothetical protein